MSIVLLILKIIGLTILGILGLILCLLLLVLFVPIRYRVSVEKPAQDDIKAEVKVTWLLHIINVKVTYFKELFYKARIMIFTLVKSDNLKTDRDIKRERKKENREYRKAEKEKIKSEKRNIELNSIDNSNDSTITEVDSVAEVLCSDVNDDSEQLTQNDIDEVIKLEDIENSDNINNIDQNVDTDQEIEKKTLFDRILFVVEKLIDFIFNFFDKIDILIDKISDIKNNLDYYIDAINDDKNKNAFNLCKKHIFSILNSIKPRKIKGFIHIGKDDPYDMGKMMSIYGILFPLIHDKIQVVPDYDNEIMEGDLSIKGKITVCVIIWALYKVYFNKDFKHMLRVFRKK